MRKARKRGRRPQQVFIPRARANEGIRVEEVRLIGPEGENLGIVPTPQALAKAREAGLDLVEISAKAVPPVARIMEHGKFLYEQEKRERNAAKTQKTANVTKGVRISMRTSGNDLLFKAQTVDKFMKKGYKVKVELFMRGREKGLRDLARKRAEEFLTLIEGPYTLDQQPAFHPRGMNFMVSPAKQAPVAAEQKQEVESPPQE
ncbi:MAG: translation initiation factor IF-3 [Candidatus Spechtbacterales bacterium]